MNKRIIVLLFATLFLIVSCASLQKKEIAMPDNTPLEAADTDASISIKLKSGQENLAKVLKNLNKVYGTPRFKVDVSRTPTGEYTIIEKLYYQIQDTNMVVVVSSTDNIITSIDTVSFDTTKLPLVPELEAKSKDK